MLSSSLGSDSFPAASASSWLGVSYFSAVSGLFRDRLRPAPLTTPLIFFTRVVLKSKKRGVGWGKNVAEERGKKDAQLGAECCLGGGER